MRLSQIKAKLQPKVTKTFEEKIIKAHQERNGQPQVKPLFKMKIFNGIESKVMQRLSKEQEKLSSRAINSSQAVRSLKNQVSQNKSMNYNTGTNFYRKEKEEQRQDENIDDLINQVHQEIKQLC